MPHNFVKRVRLNELKDPLYIKTINSKIAKLEEEKKKMEEKKNLAIAAAKEKEKQDLIDNNTTFSQEVSERDRKFKEKETEKNNAIDNANTEKNSMIEKNTTTFSEEIWKKEIETNMAITGNSNLLAMELEQEIEKINKKFEKDIIAIDKKIKQLSEEDIPYFEAEVDAIEEKRTLTLIDAQNWLKEVTDELEKKTKERQVILEKKQSEVIVVTGAIENRIATFVKVKKEELVKFKEEKESEKSNVESEINKTTATVIEEIENERNIFLKEREKTHDKEKKEKEKLKIEEEITTTTTTTIENEEEARKGFLGKRKKEYDKIKKEKEALDAPIETEDFLNYVVKSKEAVSKLLKKDGYSENTEEAKKDFSDKLVTLNNEIDNLDKKILSIKEKISTLVEELAPHENKSDGDAGAKIRAQRASLKTHNKELETEEMLLEKTTEQKNSLDVALKKLEEWPMNIRDTFIPLRHKARNLRKVEKHVQDIYRTQIVENLEITAEEKKSINGMYSVVLSYFERESDEKKEMPKETDNENIKLRRMMTRLHPKSVAWLLATMKKKAEYYTTQSVLMKRKACVLEKLKGEEERSHKFPQIEDEIKETIDLYTQKQELPKTYKKNKEIIENFLQKIEKIGTGIKEEWLRNHFLEYTKNVENEVPNKEKDINITDTDQLDESAYAFFYLPSKENLHLNEENRYIMEAFWLNNPSPHVYELWRLQGEYIHAKNSENMEAAYEKQTRYRYLILKMIHAIMTSNYNNQNASIKDENENKSPVSKEYPFLSQLKFYAAKVAELYSKKESYADIITNERAKQKKMFSWPDEKKINAAELKIEDVKKYFSSYKSLLDVYNMYEKSDPKDIIKTIESFPSIILKKEFVNDLTRFFVPTCNLNNILDEETFSLANKDNSYSNAS